MIAYKQRYMLLYREGMRETKQMIYEWFYWKWWIHTGILDLDLLISEAKNNLGSQYRFSTLINLCFSLIYPLVI